MSEQVQKFYGQDARGVLCVRADDYATLQAELAEANHDWCRLANEREQLKAECGALQEQVKALQSAENSYQSGFNAGRDSSAKFAADWREECERLRQWKAENLRIMSPVIDYARSAYKGKIGESLTAWLVEDHKRLTAELAAIKAQEPAGFRWTIEGSASWTYVDHRQPDAFELSKCKIEKLYTLPAATSQPATADADL